MTRYTIHGYISNQKHTREGSIVVIWDGASLYAKDAITGGEWQMFADKHGIDAHQVGGDVHMMHGQITAEVLDVTN